MIVAAVFMPLSASAASKVTMYTYGEVVKSGKTVYCAAAGSGILKVKVTKAGKVKSKKWLVKAKTAYGTWSQIGRMAKKGKYLYYCDATMDGQHLLRVNLSSRKKTVLGDQAISYAIKGKKLFARLAEDDPENGYQENTYSMKLNGKSKKKSSVKIDEIVTASNANGYSVIYKKKGKYIKTYLKTPKGKYCIGKSLLEK